MYQNQGSFKREGTLTNDLFVPAKSAPCQLIPSKSVGKYITPTLSQPHLPTLLAPEPLIG